MTVFEVLPEVVSSKEFLCLVTLAKLVDVVQVLGSHVPLRRVAKLFAAVATGVCTVRRGRSMESRFDARQSSTGPRV